MLLNAHQLEWFRQAWPGPLVRSTSWLFSFGEILHFIGLCLLLGSLLVIDLRLMGYFKNLSIRSVLSFLPYTLFGFFLNAASGWISSPPTRNRTSRTRPSFSRCCSSSLPASMRRPSRLSSIARCCFSDRGGHADLHQGHRVVVPRPVVRRSAPRALVADLHRRHELRGME